MRYLASEGIGQFLDIGSGIPTSGNVHEVAQLANPAARVVYADVDPVAIAHSKAILAGNDKAAIIDADVRQPEKILANDTVSRLIDFTRPVGVLLLHVLNFVADADDPAQIIAYLREALCPGSYLVIAHVTGDGVSGDIEARARATYDRANDRLWPRAKDQILGFFDGFSLVEPGLTPVHEWRAGDDADDDGANDGAADGAVAGRDVTVAWAGVGRK